MRFFRSKPPEPPSKKMRKADAGDSVVFVADARGKSNYWPHVSHEATVLEVQLKEQSHKPSLRAVYRVQCSCGVVLHPRAGEFRVLVHEEKD